MRSLSSPARIRAGARTTVALAATAGMMMAFVLPSAAAGVRPTVTPAPGPVMATALANGHYLNGTALGQPLSNIAALATATASYPGDPGPNVHPLDATVLNALNVDLGNGINLFGSNGILTLGAANQYAATTPDGVSPPTGFPAGVVSRAASGTVGNDGAIAAGDGTAPQSTANVNLTSLLGTAGITNSAIDGLGLTFGAIAGTATETNTLAQSGAYEIAGATATIHSPLVAGLAATIENAVYGPTGSVQSAVDSLVGPTGLLANALSNLGPVTTILNTLGVPLTADISIAANLQNTVTTLLSKPLTSPDGAVSIDLSTGDITVDLAKLTDLNNLPPNTELLTGVVQTAIVNDVTGLINGLVSSVEQAVTDALRNATLHLDVSAGPVLGTGLSITYDGTLESIVNGTATPSVTATLLGAPLSLPVGDVVSALLTPLNNVLFGPTGALSTLSTTLTDQILTPLTTTLAPALDSLDSVVSLIVNGQQTTSGAFTETALTITLLPFATPLAQVGLGAATVGKDTVATVPSAAINLQATGGDRQVNLTWTKPASDGGDPILGYNLYRGTTAGGESPTPINGSTLIPGLGYQDLSVTNGTTYYYVVKAVNRVGESISSNEAHATPSGAICPPPFLDVPSSNPFCMDIVWMKDNGITTGVTPEYYKPLWPTTRSQMAGFVYRQLNPGQPDLACTAQPFKDVTIDQKFCGDITWLKDHGITGGYSDGTFRPAEPITRQAISAFMFRMNHIGSPDPTCTSAPFSDVLVTSNFCGDITWMRDTGISYGYQGGTFRPQAQTTRQAMAGLVHRMVNQLTT